MPIKNMITLFVAVVVIVVAIYFVESKKVHVPRENIQGVSLALSGDATSSSPTLSAAEVASIRAQKAQKYPAAIEIVDPSAFVNTVDGKPIKIADHIGKDIVLVDFMTYSCINCQRTFPYLNAWYDKYKDKGLIIIGVHTPEFDFEKDYNNVKTQLGKYGIQFPVVLDNNYGTWSAYQNQYWPRKYLIDIDGRIVYDHIGEGEYDGTEKEIQKLLKERDERLGIAYTADNSIVQPKDTAGAIVAQSGETYFGSSRNRFLQNGRPGSAGVQTFTIPATGLVDNGFYFGGSWNVGPEYATAQGAGSAISYVYNAKNVFFVAAGQNATTTNAGVPVVVEVTLDGAAIPASLRGKDVYVSNSKTYIKISDPRLYSVIQGTGLEKHLLHFEAQSAGLEAFTLTFG